MMTLVHAQDGLEQVELPEADIDQNSDGMIALRVNDAVEELGLEYGGLEEDGRLVLHPRTAFADDLSDEDLRAALRTRLDAAGLRANLGVKSFTITPRT